MTQMDRAALRRALLSPRSVAIVGQSDDASKTTGRPLKYLRQAGYGGVIYPINPRRETVLGERAWKSVGALPETPEHAYVVVGNGTQVTSDSWTLLQISRAGQMGGAVLCSSACASWKVYQLVPDGVGGLLIRLTFTNAGQTEGRHSI